MKITKTITLADAIRITRERWTDQQIIQDFPFYQPWMRPIIRHVANGGVIRFGKKSGQGETASCSSRRSFLIHENDNFDDFELAVRIDENGNLKNTGILQALCH